MDDDEEIRKLRNRLEEIEKAIRNRRPDPILIGGSGGVLFAKATSGLITGPNASSNVTIYKADGLSLDTRTVLAYMMFSGTVPANANLYIADILGRWHIISADCP